MPPQNLNSNRNNIDFIRDNHRNNIFASHVSHGSSNTQSNNPQNDDELFNRRFSSPNNLDRSVQLTSKTALLVRQRRMMLEPLSCFLCKGYYIDATTLEDCMDSFCKSCIVSHLQSHNSCPKCGISIQRTNPLSALRSDKVLQDIVYKMIPGLYDDEMKRRRFFYKNLFGTSSSSEEDDDSTSSPNELCSGLSSEQYGVVTHPKPFYKPSDSIDLSIEPQTKRDSSRIYYDKKRQSIVTSFTGSLLRHEAISGSSFSTVDSQHFKTFLRCPAKMTCVQLKKLIAAKFNTSHDDTINLLYLNESLRDEYSLIDVAYIYDWRGLEHMRLFYIIERNSSCDKINVTLEDGQARTSNVTRQSVNIATQKTIKRVCIDPRPKYYEDQNNNGEAAIEANSHNRKMRPRAEVSSQNGASKNKSETLSSRGREIIVRREEDSVGSQRSDQSRTVSKEQSHSYSVRCLPTATVTTTTQSSLVTVANFIDAKSNHVMSRVTSTSPSATNTSSSNRKMDSANSEVGHQAVEQTAQSNNAAKPIVTPQLAFSFVTERGITIVRRINSHNESPNTSHAVSSARQGSLPTLSGSQVRLDTTTGGESDRVNQGPSEPGESSKANSTSGRPSALHTSRHSITGETASPRHQIKVKPVYKTFVDPTKLKSPNFKKLNLTARH